MNLMPLNIQLFGASLYVSAYETDIDTANNTSYVYLTISATTTGQTWNATGSAYVNATLTGQNNVCTIPTTYFNINRNSTVTVYSGKVGPFYHNTDGSLNPIQINASSYITSNYSPTGWTTCNMSTIARKSSVYASNAEIEGTSVITINKQASSFTHTLTYQFGSLSGTIVSYTSASSVNFNIPNSFYAQIPNSKTGTCTITCTTYSNGTNIGSTSTSFTVSCNESKCKPSVSATVIDAKQATVALTGDSSKLVRYKSTARITPSATSKNSASITSKSVENQVVSSYLDISNVSKNSFNVSATDSRGFVTSITKTATMIEYVQLTCSAVFKRENQTSSVVNLNYSGNYFNGSFGTTDNALTLSWKYREAGTSEWITGGTLTPTVEENTYSGSIQCGSNFDYQKNYEFMVEFSDKIDSLNSGIISLSKGQGSLEIYDKAIKANGEVLFYWD